MVTIKSYTDLNQSKVLSKILSDDSADMSYHHFVSDLLPEGYCISVDKVKYETDIPCWSLAALLSVLSDYTLQTNTDGTVFVVCESKKPMISDAYDNPVDACVSMIIKLHELKKL